MTPAIADSLFESSAAQRVREALGERDDVWIVGGALRDAALGRPVVDLDLATAGDPSEMAKAIAEVAGDHAFELSAEFGTWRAISRGESWHVDVTRLRGETVEADLLQRDFTVNSMALPLGAAADEPIDPAGGLADLGRGMLRATSPGGFSADPLRILRAARLAADLGFAVADQTAAPARSSAARAGEPAGERQLSELRLLISGPDPIGGLAVLDALGGTAGVLPEVSDLRGVEQNPNHHLDVHGHTIEVLRRLLELEGDLGRAAGERADDLRALLDEPLGDGFSRGRALRLGALLHDVGKPATRDDSRAYVTFIGHDHVGAEIVGSFAQRMRASRALDAYLRGVTLHHLRLGFLAGERPLAPRRVHEYLRATEPVSADVTLLTVADRLSARGEGPIASPEMVQAHLDLAREML
ncbi:MAG: HD domain-containing protein, partial [bacterium]